MEILGTLSGLNVFRNWLQCLVLVLPWHEEASRLRIHGHVVDRLQMVEIVLELATVAFVLELPIHVS